MNFNQLLELGNRQTKAIFKTLGVLTLASVVSWSAKAEVERIDVSDVEIQTTCIEYEEDLWSAPKIEEMVNKVGGMRNLEGSWRYGSFEGDTKPITLYVASEYRGLKAAVSGLANVNAVWRFIKVCETNKADIVHVSVKGENANFFVKGVSKSKLQISYIKRGKPGPFFTFDK